MSKRSPESLDRAEPAKQAGAVASPQPTLLSPDDSRQLETKVVARDGTIIRIRPVARKTSRCFRTWRRI